MNLTPNKRANKYDRVMSRVQNISRSTLKSPSVVTRHEIPSSVSVGAKPSGSNVSSSLFSELPIVLNDYSPEAPKQRKFVVKPKKTIRSLNPATSPHRYAPAPRTLGQPVPKTRSRGSAPVVTNRDSENWSDSHLRQCYTSRSHSKLKELKDEIKAYRETDRQMHLRKKLYQSCGVILDDVGQVAADKAVQVQVPEEAETDKEQNSARAKHWVEACRRPDFRNKSLEFLNNHYVCSLHFAKWMYQKNRLKCAVVPLLNLPMSPMQHKSMQTDDPRRRGINEDLNNRFVNIDTAIGGGTAVLVDTSAQKPTQWTIICVNNVNNTEKDITREQFLQGCDKFLPPHLSHSVKEELNKTDSEKQIHVKEEAPVEQDVMDEEAPSMQIKIEEVKSEDPLAWSG